MRRLLLIAVVTLGCAAGTGEETDTDRLPETTPVSSVGSGSGQEEEPAQNPASGGASNTDPAKGDNGDEGAETGPQCGTKTCASDESCCDDKFCHPMTCTDCCGPPAGGGGAGGSAGSGAGGSSGGGGAGGTPPPSGQCGGNCGSPEPQGAGCYCDVVCIANLDCCPDFFLYCL